MATNRHHTARANTGSLGPGKAALRSTDTQMHMFSSRGNSICKDPVVNVKSRRGQGPAVLTSWEEKWYRIGPEKEAVAR